MKSMWQNRRKDTFAKEKRLKEGLAAVHHDPTDDVSEESSEEVDATSMHKTPFSSHLTTSLLPSLDLKPNKPLTITKSSHSKLSTLTDLKHAPSTYTILSPPMTPTSDIDLFDSDDDSLRADDSIF